MIYPLIVFVFDRKKRASDSKTGIIEVRVTMDRRQKYISTGVSVLPSQWDKEKHIVNHPEASFLNLKIDSYINMVKTYVTGLIAKQKPFSFSEFEAFLERKNLKDSFFDYADRRIEERKDIRDSTRRTQKKLITVLESFGRIQTFSDLTRANIMAFDDWLHEKKISQSTVHSYHKFLKVYIRDALRNGLIEKDPYVGFKVDRGQTSKRRYLTEEEIDKIRKSNIPSESIDKVRDMFLFQCYTGLSYSDMATFDFSAVEERNGWHVVTGRRQKTGEDYYTVLLEPAMDILRKYDFKLPVMTNQQYNLRLKVLASMADLKKDLTSHMGRHSFAVSALNSGIPIEVVAKMMGHSDIATTQIYAKIVDKTVESAFSLLDKKKDQGA